MSPADEQRPPDAAPSEEGPPPVEGGRIAGTVTDFTGQPLVGVRVEVAAAGGGELDALPAMTDGDGHFLLEGLGDGRYDLRFEVGRVKARTLAVPVGTVDLKVQLARPQGILLVVKTEQGEAPPGLLHVRLEREGKQGTIREYEGRHLTTRMLLWSIRPATYKLTVWGGHWLPVEAHGVQVMEGQAAPEVQLVLSVKGGAIAGVVRDAAGRSLPDALVTWRGLDAPGPWPLHERCAETDGEGRYHLRGLPEGRYVVSAGPFTGPFTEAEVVVEAEKTSTLDL